MMIDVHLVALAVLAIINTGSSVSIQKTSSLNGEESYECGRNITLSCMFKKNTSDIVWGKANDISRIGRCDKTTCNLNPAYIGMYSISFDMTQGIFNLTIIKVTAEENGTKLICSDGSHSDSYIVRVYDSAVFIPKSDRLGDTIQAECGRSLSLSCKFRKNTFAIVWKYSDDISPIAKCEQNNCRLNPNFVGLYNYSFDKTRCMFTLTIIKVTNKYNERKLVCSDGTHSDFQIIKVMGYVPRLIEDQNLGAIRATSGCVSRGTKVSFKWMAINVVSKEETEIQQMLNYSITSCINDSDCGNDQQLQYTQTMFAKPSDKGKYYMKVIAAYGIEHKETFKTDAKYTIDEQDNKNNATKSTIVLTVVLVGVLMAIMFVCSLILSLRHRWSLERRRRLLERRRRLLERRRRNTSTNGNTGTNESKTSEKKSLQSAGYVTGNNSEASSCMSMFNRLRGVPHVSADESADEGVYWVLNLTSEDIAENG